MQGVSDWVNHMRFAMVTGFPWKKNVNHFYFKIAKPDSSIPKNGTNALLALSVRQVVCEWRHNNSEVNAWIFASNEQIISKYNFFNSFVFHEHWRYYLRRTFVVLWRHIGTLSVSTVRMNLVSTVRVLPKVTNNRGITWCSKEELISGNFKPHATDR